MAFAPGVARVLYTSALGMARQAGAAGFDAAEAARVLRARNPLIKNGYIDFYNLTRSVGLAYNRGVGLRGPGAPPLRTRQHPIDPTLAGATDRFRYRVVVHETRGGRSSYETVVIVDSPTPLDGDSIRADAISTATLMRGTSQESPRARSQALPSSWEATIISAGRQY